MKWILLVLIAGVVLLLTYFLVRSVVLQTKRGGFPTWLACPGCPKWRRGVGFYGRKKLAWYALASLSPKPWIVFDRVASEVVEIEGPDVNNGLVTVVLEAPPGRFKLDVPPSAASGVVSWMTSSPPGV